MEFLGMPINEVFILIGMVVVLGFFAYIARKNRSSGNHYRQ